MMCYSSQIYGCSISYRLIVIRIVSHKHLDNFALTSSPSNKSFQSIHLWIIFWSETASCQFATMSIRDSSATTGTSSTCSVTGSQTDYSEGEIAVNLAATDRPHHVCTLVIHHSRTLLSYFREKSGFWKELTRVEQALFKRENPVLSYVILQDYST